MALKAADGSGSRRCAVCRVPLGAVCVVGVPVRMSVVRFFKEIGKSERQNPKNFPVGSQSSRRLAALGAPAARKMRPGSFDTCQVKVQHLIRALPRDVTHIFRMYVGYIR